MSSLLSEKSNLTVTLLCTVFALLSFAIGAARGLVPIFLAEGCGWAILAVYFWRRQQPLPPLLIMSFFLSAIIVATVQFYSLTRHFGVLGRSRYNYLQRGSTLFRIDESAGRTDRLTEQGQWIPTNFDRSPEITHDITGIIMDEGSWSNGTHEICFVVANHSQYVLGSIQIRVILAENSQDTRSGCHRSDFSFREAQCEPITHVERNSNYLNVLISR